MSILELICDEGVGLVHLTDFTCLAVSRSVFMFSVVVR